MCVNSPVSITCMLTDEDYIKSQDYATQISSNRGNVSGPHLCDFFRGPKEAARRGAGGEEGKQEVHLSSLFILVLDRRSATKVDGSYPAPAASLLPFLSLSASSSLYPDPLFFPHPISAFLPFLRPSLPPFFLFGAKYDIHI